MQRPPRPSCESSPDTDGTERSTSDASRAPHADGESPSWALPLGALLGELPDGVFAIEAGRVRPLNRAALSMLGYECAAEFPQSLAQLLRELDVRDGATQQPLSPRASELAPAASVRELIIRHRDGNDRVVRCAVSPVGTARPPMNAIAVSSNVTARAMADVDAKKRAEFEQQLIGIVSHDLRNPLQVIRFAAALGQRVAGGDPRQSRQFERILSSSARALRMIDDLLDFTRIRFAGGLTVEARAVDLHALTQRVVEEVLTTHPERSVEIAATGDHRGYWDPDRLEQVVQNLVGNALQHTTEDTPVRVNTRGEAHHVVLEVHNGGPGIPSEDQARLFEPFQRGKSKSRSGRSMGLGLHITRHIVQAHGGTLELCSSDEHGTTFRVRLPRGHAPSRAEEPA